MYNKPVPSIKMKYLQTFSSFSVKTQHEQENMWIRCNCLQWYIIFAKIQYMTGLGEMGEVRGFNFGDVLMVSKEPGRREGRMRGSSLVQVGRKEESEREWWSERLLMDSTRTANSQQLWAHLNGGRKRQGEVYAPLQSNYASQAHIKHSSWSPTGIGLLHQQKPQESANLHFEAQLLFLPMHRFNNNISQHDVTLVQVHHLFFPSESGH